MEKKDYDLTLNVMMIGGRRCGKTSVLASMQNCFEKQIKQSKLVIGPADFDILDIISSKQEEMNRYFKERGTRRDFIPDDSPTDGIMGYPFYVGIRNKKSRICVSFIDYPGEMLKNKQDWETLKSIMEKSRILLVVIDTPHLMEEKGIYNDSKNLCRHVFEMIKDVGFADSQKGPGMVLFIPLKCERYYNNKKMNEVAAKVEEVYDLLIQHLKQPGEHESSSKITVGITPILTMSGSGNPGGAEFSRFQRNDDGDIEVDSQWGTPVRAFYHFLDMSQNEETPNPRYCEQPLLYVLSYLFTQADQIKKSQKKKYGFLGGILNWFQNSLLDWPSASDYLEQGDEIRKKIKIEGDGYRILNKGTLKL